MMSEVLRRALDGDAGRAAKVRKALLVRGLGVLDCLDGIPPTLDLDAVLSGIAPVVAIPLPQLLENSTPFFWLNIARFYDAVANDDDVPRATQRLLATAFGTPPTEFALPVPGAAGYVLPINDPTLFEETYREQILTQCDPHFPGHLGAAIDLIRVADPETAERITKNILWYVPIASPNEATHCSFTSPRLHGVTFLSQSDDALRLAEAVVHEFGHTELHVLMSVSLLTGDIEPDELFYSPWRLDPRPIAGLFHGLYVFSEVLSFLANVAARQLSNSSDAIERMPVIAHRLRIGLAQAPRERLDPLAIEMLDEIESNLNARMRSLGIALNGTPPFLTEHLQQWISMHPELAPRVAAI